MKMREIKFRAYDKDAKPWNEKYSVRVGGEHRELTEMYSWEHLQEYGIDIFIEPGSWDIMQYTGLKDKNGVGVYEGDILLVDESGRFGGLYNIAVEWVDWHDKNVIGGEKGHHWAFFGCVCLKAKEITNYNPSASTIFTRGFLTRKYGSCIELSDMTRNDNFAIQVIGNIYQNPELLK